MSESEEDYDEKVKEEEELDDGDGDDDDELDDDRPDGDGGAMDEEDEEGEEEGEREERKPKRQKLDRSKFYEQEAEESDDEPGRGGPDDDDELDDDNYEYDDFVVRNNGEVNEGAEAGVHNRFNREEAESMKKELEGLRQRHETQGKAMNQKAEDKRLPSIEDPQLFVVKCKPGKENEIILAIMKRYYVREKGPEHMRLPILSAFTTPAAKSFIYIEAMKRDHVTACLQNPNIQHLYVYGCTPVNITEMIAAITIRERIHKIRDGQYVRLTQGVYKGDLAKIVRCLDQNTKAEIKIIPRIDIQAKIEGKKPQRGAMRPPAKLVDLNEIEELDPERKPEENSGGGIRRTTYSWRNLKFTRDGYLLKEYRASALQKDAVNPTLEEIEKFTSGKDAEDEGDMHNVLTSRDNKITFLKGDRVIVIDGSLKNLIGRVHTVSDKEIAVMPEYKGLNEALDFTPDQLAKYFEHGAHVKIITGKRAGETGLIVHVNQEDNTVVVFSDTNAKKITVFAHDVAECTEVSAGRETLGNYRLYDLVQLGQGNFGVIVKVENTGFQIMDRDENVRNVGLQEVGKKRFSDRAVAADMHKNPIGKRDLVRVVEGDHQGDQGEIKHIFKNHLFLYNRRKTNSSGIFAVPSRHCLKVGAESEQNGRDQRDQRGQFNNPPKHFSFGRGRRRNMNNEMYGEKVLITRGNYKRHTGIVKEATDTHFRVELEDPPKVISVPKDHVKRREDIQRMREEPQDYSGSATPLIGGRTPRNDGGGRTPMYGAMTPSYEGSMTPAQTPGTPGTDVFNPSALQTPRNDDEGAAGEWTVNTPAGQADERTPHTPLTSNPLTSATPHTPQTFNPMSPYAAAPDSAAPETMVNTPAPSSPIPSTPFGVGTPVQNPDEGNEDYGGIQDGLARGIAIVHNGTPGVVRAIEAKGIQILLDGHSETQMVQRNELEVTRPVKGDTVIVLFGENQGKIGEFTVESGGEAFIQVGDDQVIVSSKDIAKYMD